MFSIVIIAYGRVTMSYLSSINHFKSLLSTNIVRIVFLFPMSFYFVKDFGLSYIGIPIGVSELFASILLPAYFAKKELGTDFHIKDYCIMLLSALFLFVFMLIQYMEWLSFVKLYLLSAPCITLIALYQWGRIPIYVKQSIFTHFKIDKYFIKYPL